MQELAVEVAAVGEAHDHRALGLEQMLDDVSQKHPVVDPGALQGIETHHEIVARQLGQCVEVGLDELVVGPEAFACDAQCLRVVIDTRTCRVWVAVQNRDELVASVDAQAQHSWSVGKVAALQSIVEVDEKVRIFQLADPTESGTWGVLPWSADVPLQQRRGGVEFRERQCDPVAAADGRVKP